VSCSEPALNWTLAAYAWAASGCPVTQYPWGATRGVDTVGFTRSFGLVPVVIIAVGRKQRWGNRWVCFPTVGRLSQKLAGNGVAGSKPQQTGHGARSQSILQDRYLTPMHLQRAAHFLSHSPTIFIFRPVFNNLQSFYRKTRSPPTVSCPQHAKLYAHTQNATHKPEIRLLIQSPKTNRHFNRQNPARRTQKTPNFFPRFSIYIYRRKKFTVFGTFGQPAKQAAKITALSPKPLLAAAPRKLVFAQPPQIATRSLQKPTGRNRCTPRQNIRLFALRAYIF
jgi:hypothetical protein